MSETMTPSSSESRPEKEDIIRRVMESSDHKEKMALINDNFDLFSAREIEELSHRVIEDLQESLERHERAKRRTSRQQPVPAAIEPDDMTMAVDNLRAALDAQIERERSSVSRGNSIADSRPGSVPHFDDDSDGPEEEANLEGDAADLCPVAPALAESPVEVPTRSHDFIPLTRKTLQARAQSAAHQENGRSGVGTLVKWSIAALVVNALAFLSVFISLGPSAAGFAPLAIWIVFCLWGHRRDHMVAPLSISLLAFLFLGWGAIQNVLVSLFLIPTADTTPVDHIALIATFLGLFTMTFFWRPLGKRQHQAA